MSVPVTLERDGDVATITLARPPLNVLDIAHLEELADSVEAAHSAGIIVLQAGSGCRAFSAGNAVEDHVPERAEQMLTTFHRAVYGLLGTDAITVADIAGDAFGGGCELIAACDLAYTRPGTHFGQPEIDVGCFPPVAVSLLPRRIGWTRAVELIALGERIDAETAADWGLITRVSETGAAPYVGRLSEKSSAVLRATKRALVEARRWPASDGIAAAERVYRERLLPLADCEEGIRAFLDKRPPRWRGQ